MQEVSYDFKNLKKVFARYRMWVDPLEKHVKTWLIDDVDLVNWLAAERQKTEKQTVARADMWLV